MGREAKILLAFLGLLAGVFCGVLSMKLLVPRPPTGAGPDIHDIHDASTFAEPTEIVEPPLLATVLPLRATDFAAAPPLVDPAAARLATESLSGDLPEPDDLPSPDDLPVPAAAPQVAADTPAFDAPAFAAPPAEPIDGDLLPPPAEFVLAPPARPIDEAEPAVTEPRDPFVAKTDWQPPPPAAAGDVVPAVAPPPGAAVSAAGSHVVRAGDSWWSLAEAAYGDGRLYRALFAWNRAVDPRVTLAAGTPLEVPPLEKLRAAWPKLVPPSRP